MKTYYIVQVDLNITDKVKGRGARNHFATGHYRIKMAVAASSASAAAEYGRSKLRGPGICFAIDETTTKIGARTAIRNFQKQPFQVVDISAECR